MSGSCKIPDKLVEESKENNFKEKNKESIEETKDAGQTPD